MKLGRIIYKIVRRVKYYLPYTPPKKWVFVVGCNNSGTSVVHDLVAKLPDVASLPMEGHSCTTELIQPYKFGYKRLYSLNIDFFKEKLKYVNLIKLKKDWASYMVDRTCSIWLEKSPPNTMRISWLNKHFENAVFIGVVRNGLAVVEGIKRKADSGYNFSDYVNHWEKSNELLLSQLSEVEDSLLVKYEDVVADPSSFLNKVSFLLGNNSCEVNHSDIQVQEYPEGIKNYNEEAIGRLSENEIQVFNKRASLMMKKLGYPLLDVV